MSLVTHLHGLHHQPARVTGEHNHLRLIPLSSIPSAFTTAELLFDQMFRYFGIPEEIVGDRGPQFMSLVWSSFMSKMGTTINLTSVYHPQANSQVEQANQKNW